MFAARHRTELGAAIWIPVTVKTTVSMVCEFLSLLFSFSSFFCSTSTTFFPDVCSGVLCAKLTVFSDSSYDVVDTSNVVVETSCSAFDTCVVVESSCVVVESSCVVVESSCVVVEFSCDDVDISCLIVNTSWGKSVDKSRLGVGSSLCDDLAAVIASRDFVSRPMKDTSPGTTSNEKKTPWDLARGNIKPMKIQSKFLHKSFTIFDRMKKRVISSSIAIKWCDSYLLIQHQVTVTKLVYSTNSCLSPCLCVYQCRMKFSLVPSLCLSWNLLAFWTEIVWSDLSHLKKQRHACLLYKRWLSPLWFLQKIQKLKNVFLRWKNDCFYKRKYFRSESDGLEEGFHEWKFWHGPKGDHSMHVVPPLVFTKNSKIEKLVFKMKKCLFLWKEIVRIGWFGARFWWVKIIPKYDSRELLPWHIMSMV